MKIRTIMAAAVTGIFLTAAGGSLAFGAEWTCPGIRGLYGLRILQNSRPRGLRGPLVR